MRPNQFRRFHSHKQKRHSTPVPAGQSEIPGQTPLRRKGIPLPNTTGIPLIPQRKFFRQYIPHQF